MIHQCITLYSVSQASCMWEFREMGYSHIRSKGFLSVNNIRSSYWGVNATHHKYSGLWQTAAFSINCCNVIHSGSCWNLLLSPGDSPTPGCQTKPCWWSGISSWEWSRCQHQRWEWCKWMRLYYWLDYQGLFYCCGLVLLGRVWVNIWKRQMNETVLLTVD